MATIITMETIDDFLIIQSLWAYETKPVIINNSESDTNTWSSIVLEMHCLHAEL